MVKHGLWPYFGKWHDGFTMVWFRLGRKMTKEKYCSRLLLPFPPYMPPSQVNTPSSCYSLLAHDWRSSLSLERPPKRLKKITRIMAMIVYVKPSYRSVFSLSRMVINELLRGYFSDRCEIISSYWHFCQKSANACHPWAAIQHFLSEQMSLLHTI